MLYRVVETARAAAAAMAASLMALTLVVVCAAGVAATPAQANPKYAALVIDKASGRVLFSRNPDSQRFPASLTKIMTLYIVFDELAAGNITLDTEWRVSAYAAGQAPSKLGLEPGSTITVEEAILALVTKSANDVAVVVAEGIGGTERDFAKRMTETARDLGMARTTFRNPHGLPDKRQVTTARDMATLAVRIMDDFPQYYGYFGTQAFNFRGRAFRNHNNLLGRYEGTNGIKTGYTRASGFNLTASVTRDGKHLIGVVLGGRTPRSRDAHMVEILNASFDQVPRRASARYAENVPTPLPRPATNPDSVAAALAPPTPAPSADTAPGRTGGGPFLELADLAPQPRPAPAKDDGAAPSGADLGAGDVSEDDAGVPAGTRIALADAGADAGWRIQIGAYADPAEAGRRIEAAVARASDVLSGRKVVTVPVETPVRTLYRARFAGFSDETQARDVCATLIREGISCITVPPPTSYAAAQ